MGVLYICDRRACEKCNPACNHTSDIKHAVNFEASPAVPGMMVESEPLAAEDGREGKRWLAYSVILWAITVAVTVLTQLT